MIRSLLSRCLGSVFLFALIFSDQILAESIEITNAWTPPQPSSVSVHAGYFTLHNNSQDTLTLVGVSSPEFSAIEIHESQMIDGVFQMRRLSEISIEARTKIEFKPTGLHLMMRNMTSKKVLGDNFPVKLFFASGDSVEFVMSLLSSPSEESVQHRHHHDRDQNTGSRKE